MGILSRRYGITSTSFFSVLHDHQHKKNSLLCIGLDPDPTRLPATTRADAHPFFAFNRAIIDATRDVACCFKPQIAHYAAQGREDDLQMTIDYLKQGSIPVVLDAKRGDVGATAEMYARELFDRYGADAVTINPYLGLDAMEPFLEHADRGIFILCRTSNPGSAELQNLELNSGLKLYEHVARLAASTWNHNGNVGLVVGATKPTELRRVRELTGQTTLLLPGVGSQGADVAAAMAAGAGGSLVISSSRSIIFAEGRGDFTDAARASAIATRDEINQCRDAA